MFLDFESRLVLVAVRLSFQCLRTRYEEKYLDALFLQRGSSSVMVRPRKILGICFYYRFWIIMHVIGDE